MATTATHPESNTLEEGEGSPVADLRFSREPDGYLAILADPAVKPFVLQEGEDFGGLEPILSDPANVAFLFDGCCFLAVANDSTSYEVHSAALPRVRGRYVRSAARLAIRSMFLGSPALELVTRVVEGNLGAKALARSFQFEPEFTRPAFWRTAEGLHDVAFYALRYHDWIKRQGWLRSAGEWFHGMLGETVTHGDDPVHDLYVGAAVEMILGGQPDKAVCLYNRWASLYGAEKISLVDRDPLSFNIVSHLVTLRGDKLEVLPCQ